MATEMKLAGGQRFRKGTVKRRIPGNRKAAIEMSTGFIVMLIISLVIFTFSVYFAKQFFGGAQRLKDIYDERAEREIERLLDDGSRVAIPFDKKTISNGGFDTFGIGVLNVIGLRAENNFRISIKFSKAFDRQNAQICQIPANCGDPNTWLKSNAGDGDLAAGITFEKIIRNNAQDKFLIGVGVKDAPFGTYVFDVRVCVDDKDNVNNEGSPQPGCDGPFPDAYENVRKLYVEVR